MHQLRRDSSLNPLNLYPITGPGQILYRPREKRVKSSTSQLISVSDRTIGCARKNSTDICASSKRIAKDGPTSRDAAVGVKIGMTTLYFGMWHDRLLRAVEVPPQLARWRQW